MSSHRPIVITGFMGCGKTEVAGYLAKRLNVGMVDLDELITQTVGRSPAKLINEEGEPAFRVIETSALDQLLKQRSLGVIALGGGAWIESQNRVLIEQCKAISVFLDTLFEVCWSRIETSSEDRPLGRTKTEASELYQLRRPIYQLANICVTANVNDNPDFLASRIQVEIAQQESLLTHTPTAYTRESCN